MSYALNIKFTFNQSVRIKPIDTIGIITGIVKYNDAEIKYYTRWYDDKSIVEQYYYEWELENHDKC